MNQTGQAAAVEFFVDGADVDGMVDAFQAVCQGFGFGLADIALVKCDLALQVVQFDRVGIGYGQRADAGSGKVGQGGGTQSAAADDQNMRGGKFLLPFDADFVQEDVAAVPQQECIVVVVFGRGHDDVRKKQLRAIVTLPSGGVQLQTAFRDTGG